MPYDIHVAISALSACAKGDKLDTACAKSEAAKQPLRERNLADL